MSSQFADPDGYYTFELDGHTYTGHLLDAEKGFGLAVRLSSAIVDPLCAILGPPLLKALGSPDLIASFQGAVKGGDGDLVGAFLGTEAGALAEAAEAINPAQVAAGIQQVIQSMDLATVRAVLEQTYRDGDALHSSAAFNRAYRGNYAEAFKAAVKVARGNGFLPDLATIVGSVTGAVASPAASGSGRSGDSSTTRHATA